MHVGLRDPRSELSPSWLLHLKPTTFHSPKLNEYRDTLCFSTNNGRVRLEKTRSLWITFMSRIRQPLYQIIDYGVGTSAIQTFYEKPRLGCCLPSQAYKSLWISLLSILWDNGSFLHSETSSCCVLHPKLTGILFRFCFPTPQWRNRSITSFVLCTDTDECRYHIFEFDESP